MRFSVAVVAVCLASIGLTLADEARASIRKPTYIPPEELGRALQTLAQERGFQVVYVSEEVDSRRTRGVSGELTTDEALTELLRDTGLSYRHTGDNGVMIILASAAGNSRPSAHQQASSQASDANSQHDDGSEPGKAQRSFWDRFRLAQTDQGRAARSDAMSQGQTKSDPSPRDEKNEPPQIAQVVITAEKRSEKLEDVPLAVSVLSEATLRDIGAVEFSDYERLVPGLTAVDMGVGQKKYILRGLNSESAPSLAPIVEQYLDEFPLTQGTLQSDIRLYDVERVEVLRGPQGTLYGAGSMGGTIRTITRKPNLENFDARVELTGSDTGHGGGNFLGNAVVNVPLVPGKLAIRAVVFDEDHSGFIDNVYSGRKGINDDLAYGGRVSLLWQATDALALDLMVMRQSERAGAQNDVMPGFLPPPRPPYFPPFVPWFPANTPPVGDLQVAKAIDERQHDDNTITNLLVTYDFGWANLTSSSTYYRQHKTGDADVTQFLGFGGWLTNHSLSNTFGQELRLARDRGPFKWLIGGYYTHGTQPASDNGQTAFFPGGALFFQDGNAGRATATAAFGETSYDFLPQLTGTVGIRSQRSSGDRSSIVLGGTDPGGLPVGTVTGPFSIAQNKVTTKYELTYRPAAQTTIYASAAQGFRPGGFNDVAFNPATNPNGVIPKTFKSDELWNYELGLKTYLLDGRATLNTAIYYIDWSGIQVTAFAPTTAISYETNAGKAKVQGAETELSLAATQHLRLSLSGAFTDARLTEDEPPNPGVPAPGIGLPGLKGDRLPDVPRWSGSVVADYRRALGLAGWTGFGTAVLTYTGESATLLRPDDPFYRRVGNYALTGLRCGAERSDWRVTAFVDNLADRRAKLFVNSVTGWDTITVNRPRTVGVTVSKQFAP
jgi:outer membrane receptor protein involved in Fe transport